MRVVVIGGTGHIGTYLIPRLAASGYEVINISRSQRAPYRNHGAWQWVKNIERERSAEERSANFGKQIRDLRPDAVIDLICFTVESARHLVQTLRGEVQHFLHCGTIWVHGPSVQVPTTEEAPRTPFGDYGIRKAAALTLRGYAQAVSAWFGKKVSLRFLSWDEWKDTVSMEEAAATWDHIAHSPNCSIEKARRLLDYQPRYSSLEAVYESLHWLIEHQVIKV